MPPAFERRHEPLVRDGFGRRGNIVGGEHEDVGVVVPARQARRIQAMAKRRTDTAYLVRRDAHPDAAFAGQYPALDAAGGHGLPDLQGDIGVIRGRFVESAQVFYGMAGLFQSGLERLFHLKSPVVGTDRDFHQDNLP